MDPRQIVTRELAKELVSLTSTLKRQIAVLISRRGEVTHVVLGDHKRVVLPDLKRFRVGPTRMRGLRMVHTHVKDESLTDEDIKDMLLLRLDLVGLIKFASDGVPTALEVAHINPAMQFGDQLRPGPRNENPSISSEHSFMMELPDCMELISSIDEELTRNQAHGGVRDAQFDERAIIVHVADRRDTYADEILAEMHMLAHSSRVDVLDTVVQHRSVVDPSHLLGKGKLSDLAVQSLCMGATMLMFSCDLTPKQVKKIAEATDLKIIDRTQLILDIFARRAKSRDGKLQVELAQLKYLLPRLVQQDSSMSRLMGGIGGRGPGETKLEIDRRRVRERIARLEREIKQLSNLRQRKRALRMRSGTPIIALVGYTNVGKSTLFNLLSGSTAHTEDAAFATLDPTSRKIWLPSGRHAVLLDTVGFIRDLPPDLTAAFKATLEEIQQADLILHVNDVSHEDLLYQMESVDKLLVDMGLETIAQLRVLNKIDRVSKLQYKLLAKQLHARAISALDKKTVGNLLLAIDELVRDQLALGKVAPL